MANNFFTKNSKILLQLNMISIVIIFFCEIFVIYTFETKAFVEGIEIVQEWRATAEGCASSRHSDEPRPGKVS